MKRAFAMWLMFLAAGFFLPILGGCSSSGGNSTDNGDTVKMLNSVLAYIKKNHPEAAALIPDALDWTSSDGVRRPGFTSQTYTAAGWVVTVSHTVTLEVTYDIKAENSKAGIVWTGSVQNGTVRETGYQRR